MAQSKKEEKVKKKQEHVCPYETCKLPRHNYNYLAQFFYLVLAYIFLIRSTVDFSATNIVLYITPIAIDLVCSRRCSGLPGIIQMILYITIIGAAIIGISSILGFFETTSDAFIVSENAVLFSGMVIKKTWIAIMLIPPLFTPWILSVGTITRNDVISDSVLNQIDEEIGVN